MTAPPRWPQRPARSATYSPIGVWLGSARSTRFSSPITVILLRLSNTGQRRQVCALECSAFV
nr:hypothetical protein [Fodinicola feengrottensis]